MPIWVDARACAHISPGAVILLIENNQLVIFHFNCAQDGSRISLLHSCVISVGGVACPGGHHPHDYLWSLIKKLFELQLKPIQTVGGLARVQKAGGIFLGDKQQG